MRIVFECGLRAGWLLILFVLLSACSSLPERPLLSEQFALPTGTSTTLDREIAPMEVSHPERSGFVMLDEGRKAFAARVQVTRVAERSLDVQTYIWHNDGTGLFLAHEVLAAADRGVRVRMLLDDIDSRAKHDPLVALDRHPNIEIRLFNPLASRRGKLTAMVDFFRSFHRLNHRMHIKNWVADNRVAIAGGRNVGDEYFTASEDTNFADFELMMLGPVVRDASSQFDRYWNSSEVYPIELLNGSDKVKVTLEDVRTRLADVAEQNRQGAYADALRSDDAVQRLARGEERIYWLDDYQLVADAPNKIELEGILEKSAVLSLLLPVLQNARHDVVIVSPYFVPGKEGTELLVGLVQKGIKVRLLTNSLAANDVAAVHGGYSRYREALVQGGVQIWELKPSAGAATKPSMLGSSGASLHAKALTVDGERLFVGSYNLDPRSTALNAEMGVLVHSVEMTGEFNSGFEQQVDVHNAWKVEWIDGELHWRDEQGLSSREPVASRWRQFQAWLARVLRVDPLL